MISLITGAVWASGLGPRLISCALAVLPIYPWAPVSQTQLHESTETVTQSVIARVEDIPCSINAVDMDLSRVLRTLSDMTKANLVLLSGQTTKLTLRLTDVRLGDLLRHICALSGLSCLKVGDTFVLATEQQLQNGYPKEWEASHVKLAKPANVVEMYNVNFANAGSLVESLKAAFPDGVTITLGPGQTSPSVSSQDTANVTGIQSGVIQGDDKSKNGRVILIRGQQEAVAEALAMAKKMDYERPQVSIKVTIHDISNEALKEIGASWNFGDVNITESGNNGIGIGSFSRNGMTFSAVVKALEKMDKAKLLASPNVSVLDGERAFILIGSRLSYPVLIGYSQANTPIYDKQTERVGIYLQVAASIADNGKITLNIYPQVSTITGFLQVNGASYPQVSTREAQTTLRVDNNETIILGGLLRDEEVQQLEKVPLLSDIPVLGEIFKRRKRTKVSSQVVITITPVIIPSREK